MKALLETASLRVAQSVAIVRHAPLVLFGNGLSCLFASMTLGCSFTFAERLPIVAVMWMLLVPVAMSWLRLRKRAVPAQVSEHRIQMVTAYSGVLGLTIASFMAYYLPHAPFEVSAIIIMGCGFMAAGSAAVLYVIPLACVLYAGPIMITALALLARSSSLLTVPVALLVALMACGVGWMLYANWRNFLALVQMSDEKTEFLQTVADATAAKSEFLENISHEIKNPLTSVIGYANLLREAQDKMAPELRPYIKNVVTGGEALKALLDDLLDLAKLDADRIELQPVSFAVKEFFRDTVSLVRLTAEAKNLELTLSFEGNIPDWQFADPFRLRQVLLNLLGNAIKFTSAGRVDIVVSWSPDSEGAMGRLLCRIADTGPGIHEAERARLFARFSKLNADGVNAPEGSGLGLAICKLLVDLMGGEIRLGRLKGYASVFVVEIPTIASSPPEMVPPALPPLGKTGAPKRILVVDDIAENRELICLMLAPCGHRLTEASSGMEAFTLCQSQKFDLILMDIEMPGMDGIMATRLVRRRCQLNFSTPVVGVTGHVAQTHLDEFAEAGMNDHLTKPLYKAALLRTVGNWTVAEVTLNATEEVLQSGRSAEVE